MQFKSLAVLTSLSFSALLYGSAPVLAQSPSLGTARGFAVLGGSTVTNAGTSTIVGDLGVSPGTGITGFPPGSLTGTFHPGDALALQAQSDLTTAYNALTGAACSVVMTGQDLGGRTLTPGVYCFAASAPLNGVLTLDAQGDPNAVFIFQIGSTLLAAINSSVHVINGAQPDNVFWRVGSSATLAGGVSFTGNVIALSSITLSVGSSLSGRALARTGAVTMDTTSVSTPVGNTCGTPASVFQLMSGCGFPTAPILTCTPPVMGQPALFNVDGSVASATGIVRLSPFRGPLVAQADLAGSIEPCSVYASSQVFVLARFVTDVNGDFAFTGGIPSAPGFCGTRWVAQGLLLAPTGTKRFGASNALLLQLGN